MHTTGIICEYNPMHSGHAYQLRRVRETGTDATVLVMSGSFTERGEIAVCGKYERAEIAVRAGADLVLELPYPYCAASAEYFARAGVEILDRLGVNTLCFGSETGDAALLDRAAEVARSGAFREAFTATGNSGKGSAAAYFDLLNEFLGTESFGANDVLGVEYLKAIKRIGSEMKPFVLLREGAGYHAETVSAGAHPSATAIRKAMDGVKNEDCAEIYESLCGLDREIVAAFRRAVLAGDAPVRPENAEAAILGFYRMQTPQSLHGLAEMHGGLAERICSAANEATDLASFLTLASTKKYTDSRVRRAILYGMTGVREADLNASPAYVNLLGASERGRAFLAQYRKKKDKTLAIVTRPAAILDDNESDAFRREAELQLRAEALYAMFSPLPRPAHAVLRRRAFF